MKPLYLTLLLLGATICNTQIIDAQTVRVRCTTGGNSVSYREVYEYDYVTEKPTFPGGAERMISFINHTRNYPGDAYRRGIVGRVSVSFVVNSDGSISDIAVIRGVERSLNTEAVRIISEMPDWTPGRIKGKCVPVRVIQTIPFRK